METIVKILIVGGGATGFGDVWRLNELFERKLSGFKSGVSENQSGWYPVVTFGTGVTRVYNLK